MQHPGPTDRLRVWELDGQLLYFDRRTGINQLLRGEQTAASRQGAPRVLQVGLTNRCNRQCSFCYAPQADEVREWGFDEILALAQWAAQWGVLEIAFGGGEPTLVPRFGELIVAIWEQTPLCPSFTTNGLKLDDALLETIAGRYGQIQLSLYDDDEGGPACDLSATLALLTRHRARFGLNYLVTPEQLRAFEAEVLELAARGVSDFLFLSYKGPEPRLHLSPAQCVVLEDALLRLHQRLDPYVTLKIDACWGARLGRVPQLFESDDCRASQTVLAITSDRQLQPCSFHHLKRAFTTFEEIPEIFQTWRHGRQAAQCRGCARLEGYGLDGYALERVPSKQRRGTTIRSS